MNHEADTSSRHSADRAFPAGIRAHCRASHSCLGGQPASTHSCSSASRHNVERPMRTGRGIRPAAFQLRQVRSDLLHSEAASWAETSSRSERVESEFVFEITPFGCPRSVMKLPLLKVVGRERRWPASSVPDTISLLVFLARCPPDARGRLRRRRASFCPDARPEGGAAPPQYNVGLPEQTRFQTLRTRVVSCPIP